MTDKKYVVRHRVVTVEIKEVEFPDMVKAASFYNQQDEPVSLHVCKGGEKELLFGPKPTDFKTPNY